MVWMLVPSPCGYRVSLLGGVGGGVDGGILCPGGSDKKSSTSSECRVIPEQMRVCETDNHQYRLCPGNSYLQHVRRTLRVSCSRLREWSVS